MRRRYPKVATPTMRPRATLRPRASGADLAIDLEPNGHTPLTVCPGCGHGTANHPLRDVVWLFDRCNCGRPPYPHLRPVIWHQSCHIGRAPIQGWRELRELLRFVERLHAGQTVTRALLMRPKVAAGLLRERLEREGN